MRRLLFIGCHSERSEESLPGQNITYLSQVISAGAPAHIPRLDPHLMLNGFAFSMTQKTSILVRSCPALRPGNH